MQMTLTDFSQYLKPRPRDFHKGDGGHLLILGGDIGYAGSVRLAAEAALRVGAGLVSVATHPQHASMLSVGRPEVMFHAVQSKGQLGDLLEKATVIVLGPGLGMRHWGKALFSVAKEVNKPLLIDADGLNLLAEKPFKKSNWILTPHPGEAGRLLHSSTHHVQKNRLTAVKKLQHQFGGVVVLKGAGTLVMGEDTIVSECQAGNPGMATAGMGDVLSGVIGGLLAQQIPLEAAAKLGVLIHAMAGDLAAQQGERGMIATDLMPHLRQWVNA